MQKVLLLSDILTKETSQRHVTCEKVHVQLTNRESLAVLPLHPALLQQQSSNWLTDK